jgi:ribonuclease BN (tRNA processing enzyme)
VLLVPLGTNGFIPSFGRQTMSFLLVESGAALLLDAGSGVSRLLEGPVAKLLDGIERLDVLLTHYHLDHVIGLSYLPGVARDRRLRIFAPAPPLTEGGPEALGALIAPPLFPITLDRWPMPVEVVPYGGPELEVGPFRLRVRAQRHPGGSAGVRVDDRLAYVTDTVVDPETARFARGVGTLLHEVWLTAAEAEREDAGRTGHSAAPGVADLARRAEVGRLVPVHHHPRRSAAEIAELARDLAASSGREVRLAVEGEPLDLDRR